MALWQYSFFILPRAVSGNNFKAEEIEEGFALFNDDDDYWSKEKIPYHTFSEVENVLPRGKSWSEDLIVYGNLESTCVTIFFEKDFVASAGLRVDFTTDYEYVLRQLIHFFMLNELILLDGDLNIVQLNFESIKAVIENSEKMKKYKQLSAG